MTKKVVDILKPDLKEWLGEEKNTVSDEEVFATQRALESMARAVSKPPTKKAGKDIFNKIAKLHAQKNNRSPLSFDNLPLLDEHSNWMDWAELVKDIELPEDIETVHLHTLESNDKRELFLAIVKEEVPEEVHHDLLESFILLKGTCTCQVYQTDGITREVHMREGDYINFKLGEHHDILITSNESAVAILQWLKTA